MSRLEEMQRMKAVKQRKKALFGEQFSERLEFWKKRTDKTEKDFYTLVGVSKNVVTGWKNGKAIPQEANMKKVCEVFGVRDDYFQPFDEFGEDYIYNTRAEAMSAKLQQYADKNGMDEDFYKKLISIDGFLRLFPFHTSGYTSLLVNEKEDNSGGEFPIVKFEFRDRKGRRKMMTEQDIDFIITIQKRLGSEVLELFRLEKEKIESEKLTRLIEWNLDHYDLERDEVYDRLYAVDFTAKSQELSSAKINHVFNQLAEEHGIKPHISRSEIYQKYFGEGFKAEATKQFVNDGYFDFEIDNLVEQLEGDVSLAESEVEAYSKKGFIIDEEKE